MAVEQQHLETYQELFIHRRDVYAQQLPTGAYFLKRAPVTDDVIAAHLEGRITAGWYALAADNTARWVVLDADRDDGRAQLQEAWKRLQAVGIPAQFELSRRGGHLWILFEPIAANVARRLILRVLPDVDVEVFPKQDQLTGPQAVGSLVRGPLGVHLLAGRRFPFVDPESLQPISRSVIGTLDYLQHVPRVTVSQASELLASLLDEARQPASALPPAREVRPRFGHSLSPIQRLQQQIGDPIAFIAQFVEIDDMGRGHCPLHPPDVHPSFVVDLESGRWSCFHETDPKTGRYLGGDAIEFYRRLKGLSYRAAIRELAELYPSRSSPR